MALKDLFSRHSAHDEGGQQAPGADGEPGSVSQQQDVEGRGPVGLQDRTAPGGQASPDTNQGKTEPIPATPGQPDPNAVFEPPSLDEMSIGSADPQMPSSPLARPRDVASSGADGPPGPVNPGVLPVDDRPTVDQNSTGRSSGPVRPASAGEGEARRAPGSLGVSPEEQETDVEAGAARTVPGAAPVSTFSEEQPGDAGEVNVPHGIPAEGTSEAQPAVRGVKAALPPEADR